tara:strand:- start:505 stop:1344 length:840 start_codon:yes stop_codon:yes gene_type:complete
MVDSKSKKTGDVGEYLAFNYLIKNGYNIARFGKEINPNPMLSIVSVISDCGLNYKLGGFPKELFNKTAFDLLVENCSVLPYGKHFLLINHLVDQYIKRYYWDWSSDNPMPHTGEVIRALEKSRKKKEAEILKDENRSHIKKFPGGHPGRYDFIGLKNGANVAIEVKTNSSSLNYFQYIRLSLMERFGCDCYILRVKIPPEESKKDIESFDLNKIEIKMNRLTDEKNSSIAIPSDAEFIRVLNYRYDKEEHLDSLTRDDSRYANAYKRTVTTNKANSHKN